MLAILSGVTVRVIMEFALPKDGFMIAPFQGDEFLSKFSFLLLFYLSFFIF